MHSSTSSFDLAALAKAAATAAATIAVAWAVVPAELPYDEQPVRGAATSNELVVERFIYAHPSKPVVMLGSSILTEIPPLHCRPENVAHIYLQGRSAMTGLEVLRRVNARPEVVFVEISTAAIGADEKLLAAVFNPVYRHLRTAIPSLRHNRNWVVLFYRRKIHRWHRPSHDLKWPEESIEQWNQSRALQFAPMVHEFENDSGVDSIVPGIAALVRDLQRSGTRVIFYDPVDPRLRALPRARSLREKVQAAVPEAEMIEAPDAERPLYRWDGLHFADASGLWLFNYLMKRAGVAFTPKCTLTSDVIVR